MLDSSGAKKCPRCGEVKLAGGNFYASRNSSDGRAGYCIPCMKAKAIEWQRANPVAAKINREKRLARKDAARAPRIGAAL